MSDWSIVCSVGEIPQPGARVVTSVHGPIAVFRNAENEVFALLDRCPHKGGPLSKGVVSGQKVECPLHGWEIGLNDGNALEPEIGCVRSFPVKIEDGSVFLLVDD